MNTVNSVTRKLKGGFKMPAVNPIMQFFEYEHLPEELHPFVAKICQAADQMDKLLVDGPEKEAGLRKLLEAKDCFVRASFNG